MKHDRGSGQFRHTVTIEQPKTSTSAENTLGEIDLSDDGNWLFVARRRANVVQLGGREYRQDHQQKSVRRYDVVMLGDSIVREVIGTWRFKWNDKGTVRRLNVVEGMRIQETPEVFEFDCVEAT